MTLDLNGHLHDDRLFGKNLKEIDVKHIILYGLELKVFQHSFANFAVNLEIDLENIGRIDELAHILALDNDVGCDKTAVVANLYDLLTILERAVERKLNDFAAIEDSGDKAFGTKGLH